MATASLPDKGISKVVSAGPGYVIVVDGAGQTVKRTGARNWRNNNPGNLVNATASQGVVGRDSYRDPVFDTYEHGLEAQRRLLFVPNSTKQNYASKTLHDAMYLYTPPVVEKATGQLGRPDKYIQTIIAGVPGINENTVLGSMSLQQQQQMLAVIHRVEGYKPGTITAVDGTTPTPVPAKPGSGNQLPPAPVPAPLPPPTNIPQSEDVYADPAGASRNRPQPTGLDSGTFSSNPDSIDVSLPLTNTLHDYPSYTYGLSLHLLTADEYNRIVGGQTYTPNRVLIASAGRYNNTPGRNQFIRSPYFSEDFYFENLTTNTVIGTNQHSRNTNAVEFTFNLMEPYGMTLINRLLDQANDPEMQCDNYLDMVYLLQIDFFATDDSGEIVGAIPGTTKRFPIKITQMNIKAGVRGSEYQISAVPYNHVAFEQSAVSTPANFEISAASINEFFQAATENKSSFSDAVNGWQDDLAINNKIGIPDTYSFDIHPTIAQATFAGTGAISARDTAMAMVNNTSSIRLSNLGNATKDFNNLSKNFSINAGTSIDKVIDYTVRNSSYIQNQISIPDGIDPQTYLQEKVKNANQPLNWYKIVPTVTLGKFDPVRKVYAKNITYSVQPYSIYNVKSDVAPQGKIKNFVKEYNYIYTGQNDDVLDFDINFNTLYYTAQTAYRGALTDIYKNSETTDESYKKKNTDAYKGSTQSPNSVMPMVVKPQVFNAKSRATGGIVTAKNVAVADLEDSLMTLSSADMLNVQLKILGDPQFIKQDDCFYSPLIYVPTSDPRLTPNNSLRTDYGEIYVLLTFRTPVDIDESTGLMSFSKYRTSVFSGIYRVLTVQSEFARGQFTQTLNLIRLPYQAEYDYVAKPRPPGSEQRSTDINTQDVSTLSTNKPVQNVQGSDTTATDEGTQIYSNTGVDETEPDNITNEQQDLKNINETAPTETITDQNEPQAIPDATGPSTEKQAVQQQLADLKSTNADLHQQTDDANTSVESAAANVDRYQAKVDRLSSSTNPDAASQLEVAKADLAAAQQQQAQAQAKFLSLQKQNFQALQEEKKLQDQISTLK
jgi:hypothetical protein